MSDRQRIIVMADLHLHPWAAFATGTGASNSRLHHAMEALRASLSAAAAANCPWIFAGDWVHTIGKVDNAVLNALIVTLNRFPNVVKYTVWGNHDARSRGGRIGLHETVVGALLEAVESLTLLERDVSFKLTPNGPTLSGRCYQPDGDVLPDVDGFYSDIGVYHQTVQGTSNAAGYKFPGGLSRKRLFAHHGLSLVGDIHQPQILYDDVEHKPDWGGEREFQFGQGAPLILVPGSPEHHNFGDSGPHGYWYVDMIRTSDDDRWYVERLQLMPSKSPRFVTVDYPADVPDETTDFYRVRYPEDDQQYVAQTERRLDGTDPLSVARRWVENAEPPADFIVDDLVEYGISLLQDSDVCRPVPAVLCSIKLQNFLSYDEALWTPADGATLVLGKNGAGKTTLFDAVYWCLFGKNTKGLAADDVCRWDADDDCVVELAIDLTPPESCNALMLVVRRTRGKRNTLEAWLDADGVDHPIEGASVKEVQENVLKQLGLTAEIFSALGYYSQERIFLFSRATDAERKTMLADMLGLSGYASAAQRARGLAQEAERQAEHIAHELQVNERELTEAMAQLAKAHEARDGWDLEHATKLHTLGEQLRAARAKREAEVDDVDAALAALDLPDGPTLEELELGQKETVVALSHENRMRTEKLGERRAAEQALQQCESYLASAKAGVCSQCGQVWPGAAEKITESQEAVVGWQNHIKAIDDFIDAVTSRIAHLEEQAKLYDERLPKMREAKRLQERRDLLSKTHSPAEAAAAQALRDAEQETNPWDKYIEDWGATVERLENEIAQSKSNHQTYKSTQRANEYWAHGFGREGVQSLLLDDLARAFNTARARVFPLLTRGRYDVLFQTQAVTKGGDVRERTEFVVIKDGVRRPYESSSGGQRTRIDVGVMFTLLLAVCETLQVPGILGLLVLDEVLGWIDDEGAEAFADMIQELTATIPSIYVISHDENLKGLIPNTLHVAMNEEGVSYVVR